MAKLRPYFGLCPIIDQKSLLGINGDVTPGNVIVTLDKNICVLYKISDQSQVKSWRTKEKFTSPVVYFHEKLVYCAAFNRTHLRLWYHQDSLDNLKKYKFKRQIHTLVSCNGTTFIVFENGTVGTLKSTLDQRKEYVYEDIIDANTEKIEDALTQRSNGTTYVVLFVQKDRETSVVWTAFKEHMQTDYVRFNLTKDGTTLQGYTLLPAADGAMSLLILRSDGKLYTYSLNLKAEEEIFASFDALSYKEKVTMRTLNEDYVAMYGSDSNEEGASLIIYNVQFKLTQSRQNVKLFAAGSRLWSHESCIFVCVGQHLAVVPYYLAVERLAALVGSHKATTNVDPDVEVVENYVECRWENQVKVKSGTKTNPFQDYTDRGWSQGLICEEIVPVYVDAENLDGVEVLLKYFADIPEKYVVKLLKFILALDRKHFKDGDDSNVPVKLGPKRRCAIIDAILRKKCDGVTLIRQLRSQLDVSSAVLLLRYISYALSEDSHSNVEDNTLVFWATTIIDSHYRQLVMSKDETVKEVVVYIRDLVTAYTYTLEEMQHLIPLLVREERLLRDEDKESRTHSKAYSIERLSLYV